MRYVIISSLLICLFGISWAQNDTNREEKYINSSSKKETKNEVALDTIVVTAKRYESNLFDTSQPINIINKDDIQKIQPVTIGDVFKNQPGIDVSQTGMGTERLMIRGLYDARVLILVDGIRLSEQAPGGDHALSIDPSQIERIEVVRGPASVLYGSDAIGGVINIITKKQKRIINDGARFNGSIDAGYDSATNAKLAGLSIDGGYDRFNYYLGGSRCSVILKAASAPATVNTAMPLGSPTRQSTMTRKSGYSI